MGFNKVYKVLQEVFPQVDHRALRAVAIEHSKDADVAVEVVLTEVIPFLMEKSQALSSSSERSIIKPPEVEVDASAIAQTADGFLMNAGGADEEQNGSSTYDANAGGLDEEQNGYQIYDANTGGLDEGKYGSSTYDADTGVSDQKQHGCLIYEANAGDPDSVPDADVGNHGDHIQVNGECVSGETVLPEKSQENITGASDQTADRNTRSLEDLNKLLSHIVIAPHSILGVSDESFSLDNAKEVKKDGNQEKSEVSLDQVTSLNVQDIMFTPDGSGELGVFCDVLNSDSRDSQPSCSTAIAAKEDSVNEMVNIEDNSTLNTIVTRSGEICSIDLLDGMIEDARSYKGTLSSAKESIISLMKEVEIQERATEEAKEAAAKAGLDILSKVEDLKEMIQRTKEANDKLAAEVYGERAILVTEVRELQSQLLSLSLERDKSRAILDETHQTLASRLAATEEERKVLEKEILEKKESAGKELAEEEFRMEKLVQEADMLKQAAEKNAKVRTIVDDRGRVVDTLLGEMSLISQDVRDPFSKFLSSSQATFILAFSNSSSKIMTPDQVDQVPYQSDSSENQKMTDMIPCSSQQLSSGEPKDEDVHKTLLDAGWEIFENGDYM